MSPPKAPVPPPKPGPRVAVLVVAALLVLGGILVFSFRPVLQPKETGEELHRFKPGTEWIYETYAPGGAKTRSVVTVTAFENGRTSFEEKRRKEGQEEYSEVLKYAQFIEGGYLVQAELKNGVPQFGRRIYRLGSRKSQTWRETPQEGKGQVEMRHLGLVNVEVPAGRYPTAINVRRELEDSVVDLCFVPGIGLVREDEQRRVHPADPSRGGRVYVKELIRFTLAP